MGRNGDERHAAMFGLKESFWTTTAGRGLPCQRPWPRRPRWTGTVIFHAAAGRRQQAEKACSRREARRLASRRSAGPRRPDAIVASVPDASAAPATSAASTSNTGQPHTEERHCLGLEPAPGW